MHRLELRTRLDEDVLRDVLDLLDRTTEIEGHRPVGEHKYAHLRVGARGWSGVLAYEGDRLVGYAHTRWNARGTRPRCAVEVVVHPQEARTGVAEALLDEARAVVARAGGGAMWLWVHRVEDARDTLAARLGFRVQRELAFMSRALDDPVPREVRLPDGAALREYVPGQDDDALLAVNNRAFAGHPENGGWTAAHLAERRSRPWFEGGDVLLAWRGPELLGFHWTKWHGHESDEVPAHEPVGEVYVLAVDPAAQGLGLGRALLRAGLRHLQLRGCAFAVLYVDCTSTAAVRLYEDEGFAVQYFEVCYEDEVPPAAAAAPDDLLRPA